jgi:hypothetical protein
MFTACGGDDEDAEQPAETTPTTSVPEPVTTPPPETPETTKEPDRDTVPPEEQQGDEEEIRSEAVFTGKGGKLTPREIRVPAFIAIRVILRGADDRGYSLQIGGTLLAIGQDRAVDELELDGLLPNKSYKGESPEGNVRVVASAEPGP